MSFRGAGMIFVAVLVALVAAMPALAAPQQSGNVTTTTFVAKKGGEALLDLTASAPGTAGARPAASRR